MSSLVAQMVKRLSAMQETWVWSLGWEDLLEKEMAARSSILAWKIPWTVELGRLPSMGSQRAGHDWATSLPLSFLSVKWPSICDSFFLEHLEDACRWHVSVRPPDLASLVYQMFGGRLWAFSKWVRSGPPSCFLASTFLTIKFILFPALVSVFSLDSNAWQFLV